MHGLIWVIRPLAVLMLLVSLGFAPVTDALTHGPGALAAEADHAAWHAEKGEVWQADDHQHHDSTDHDHLTVIILASDAIGAFDLRSAIKLHDQPALSGAIRGGPRRPPRAWV
jgi:hypothetical protein